MYSLNESLIGKVVSAVRKVPIWGQVHVSFPLKLNCLRRVVVWKDWKSLSRISRYLNKYVFEMRDYLLGAGGIIFASIGACLRVVFSARIAVFFIPYCRRIIAECRTLPLLSFVFLGVGVSLCASLGGVRSTRCSAVQLSDDASAIIRINSFDLGWWWFKPEVVCPVIAAIICIVP